MKRFTNRNLLLAMALLLSALLAGGCAGNKDVPISDVPAPPPPMQKADATLDLFADQAQAPELPAALTRLLPEQADMLIAVPSIEKLEAAWDDLHDMMADLEEDTDMPTFAKLVEEMELEFYDQIRQDQPLAVALTLPNMMAGVEMSWVAVLPWLGDGQGLGQIAEAMSPMHLQLEQGYLRMEKTGEYVPAEAPTPLVDFLQPGALTVAMDLEKVWKDYEPMMGFAMMGLTMPQTDPETGEAGDPAMTQDEAQALAEGLRTFFGSADVLALGADLSGGSARLTEELHMLPGSTLDPLPQPDFQKALDLTRYLDGDADWVMAYSVEPGQFLELYKDMYRTMLVDTYTDSGMMDEEAAGNLVDTYFQSMEMYMAPTAATVNLDLEKGRLSGAGLQVTDQGEQLMEMQLQMIELANANQRMLTIAALPIRKIAGVDVMSWEYQWHQEGLAEMIEQQVAKETDAEMDMDDEEMSMVLKVVADLMPRVSMAHKDGLVFWALDEDLGSMEQMLMKAGSGLGRPHARLAGLAELAGDDCQGVFDGDLSQAIALGLQIAREIAPEDVPELELQAIPASYILAIGEKHVGVDFRFGLAGLMDFVATMEEMEDADDGAEETQEETASE